MNRVPSFSICTHLDYKRWPLVCCPVARLRMPQWTAISGYEQHLDDLWMDRSGFRILSRMRSDSMISLVSSANLLLLVSMWWIKIVLIHHIIVVGNEILIMTFIHSLMIYGEFNTHKLPEILLGGVRLWSDLVTTIPRAPKSLQLSFIRDGRVSIWFMNDRIHRIFKTNENCDFSQFSAEFPDLESSLNQYLSI